MLIERLQRAARAARARLIYRLDALLGLPPLVHLALLLVLATVVVGAWAGALRILAPGSGPALSERAALWWSLTHFFDGGTMAQDPAPLRALALGATASGVVLLSVLTAAFASKMAERIQDLRSGRIPVVERDHVLLLGFGANVPLVAQQLARSRQSCTLVVLAAEDKERLETALRGARFLRHSRMRLVVRTGDPRVESVLARVAAARARAVIVVPPAGLDDACAERWTLATLLAVRTAVGPDFTGQIIVEARHTDSRELFMLVATPGVAGPGALATEVVASDDVVARVLAQSARQEGVYLALREILAFDACDIYLDPAPESIWGASFDEAHATVTGAVLLGVRTAAGATRLCPAAMDGHRLARGDRLIVLAPASRRYRFDGTLDAPVRAPACAAPTVPAPVRVTVLGFDRTLPHVLREFDEALPGGSCVRVIYGDAPTRDVDTVAELARGLGNISVEFDPRDPIALARAGDPALYGCDTLLILGRQDAPGDDGDASALALLLHVRLGLRRTGRTIGRVLTEVRDPRAAAHVFARPHDFVVSSDVVALLLAQEAVEPDLAPVYRELLSAGGTELFVRPRERYVPDGRACFADVMVAARARGEIALGLYPREAAAPDDGNTGSVWLNPPRATSVPERPGAHVVVLAPASRRWQ